MTKLILAMFLMFLFTLSAYSQWEESNGGSVSGQICSILFDDTVLFISNNKGEIFLSTDEGNSWELRINGIPTNSTYITSIVKKDNNIYAAISGGGIYCSSDNGLNWTPKNNGLNNLYISTMFINNNDIWVGTQKGVYFSSDNGENWISKSEGINTLQIQTLIVKDDILFVGGFGFIFYSTDYGDTWVERNSGINIWAVSFADCGKNLLVGGNSACGIYKSTDYGENWTKSLSDVSVVTFAQANEHIFAGTHFYGVYLSLNNEFNWEAVNNGLSDLCVQSLAVSDKYVFAGTDNGIYRALLSNFGITSVNDYSKSNNLSIYPNPVSNKAIFTLEQHSINSKIEIYTISGLKVFEHLAYESFVELDLQFLPKGFYIAKSSNGSVCFIKE